MTECFNCLAIIIEVTVNNIHATPLSIHCIIQDNLQKQLYIFAEMIPCTYTRTTNCDCQGLHKIKGEKGIPFLLGKQCYNVQLVPTHLLLVHLICRHGVLSKFINLVRQMNRMLAAQKLD